MSLTKESLRTGSVPAAHIERVVTIVVNPDRDGRFLDAYTTASADHGVVTRTAEDDGSQRWLLTDQGGGAYTIMQLSTGRYLDAHEIESRNFRAVTRPWQGNPTQLWQLTPLPGDLALVQQVSTGRALQASFAPSEDFRVTTRHPEERFEQQWRLATRFAMAVTDRSGEFGAPHGSGAPAVCVNPAAGVDDIIYRDGSGHLHELWRDARGATGTADLTRNARDHGFDPPAATGNPCAFVDRNNQIVVAFRGDDGGVHSLYSFGDGVGHDPLSGVAGAPHAADDPSGYYDAARDTFHVVYRGVDNNLHDLYAVGTATIGYDGPLTGPDVRPAGRPVGLADVAFNYAIYRGVDGQILSRYRGPQDGVDHLSGVAGTPRAAGDPAAIYIPRDDYKQIVYRAGDGHLYELFAADGDTIQGRDVTGPPSAPDATGTPAVYYHAATNTVRAVYRAGDATLHEIGWTPGGVDTPWHVDLSGLARHVPGCADAPAAFAVDESGSQHVAYRTSDGHLYELRRW
ncbi:RICIN domain-containing protein [Actinoplanes sp. CA-030573]|uniref:RICIN domain-containing protein n=1 Tax=Actinoplanes sp. CA-030573 TaxID=3239898 RepID=UPI003D8B62D7